MASRPLSDKEREAQAEHFRRIGDKETAARVRRGEIDFDPAYLEHDPRLAHDPGVSGDDISGIHPPQEKRKAVTP